MKKAGLKCPQCGSSQVYNRALSQDFRCQKCGWIGKLVKP